MKSIVLKSANTFLTTNKVAKMKKNIFAMLALSLGLGMSFTSCSDTDLDSSNGGSNGEDTEVTDAEFQKKMKLNCLLGAVAGVDSLPNNWNNGNYRVSIDENTIGYAESDANPGVRLVPTSSASEAYRKFVNMTASSNSGETPQSEEWKYDGIGTMTFKQVNASDLYATVDVNIEQMPNLTQIKFVPASATGHNASFSGTPYYQFGDVVLQTKDGEEPTYWVCVRPASKIAGVQRTFWCTFQLNSVTSKNANYKEITSKKYNNMYLPTKLAESKFQAKAAENVQNFFNVLRIIANPKFYENQSGIDDITNKEFEPYLVKAISSMWDDKGLWDLVKNKNYSGSPLKDYLTNAAPTIEAFYYGYSCPMFSSYAKVYNTQLNVNTTGSNTLFNKATNTEPRVDFSSSQIKNFADFETGSAMFNLSSEEKQARGPYQFIVKFRTGAQLEERFWSSAEDTDPTKSLEETGKDLGFKDILVSRNLINSKTEQTGPFYAFGDKVTETKGFNGTQFCIKETNSKASFTNAEDKKTFFLASSTGKVNIDKGGSESGEKISEDLAKNILYHLMNAYVYNETNSKSVALDISGNYTTQYHNSLKELYTLFGKESGIEFSKSKVTTTGTSGSTTSTDNYIYTVKVRFYMDTDDVDASGKVTTPVTVTLTYDTSKKSNKSKGFAYSIDHSNNTSKSSFLRVYKYQDNYTYQESYSISREFGITGAARNYIKNNLYSSVNTFLNYLKQQETQN